MGWPVILTPQSQEDLRGIVSFISHNSPDRARRFGNRLIEQARSIGNFPEMGRIVPEIGEPTVREIIHGSYRIVYELLHNPDAVYILRFWHAARGNPEPGED